MKDLIVLGLAGLLVACGSPSTADIDALTAQLEALRVEYAPDKRVALFQVDVSSDEGRLVVTGETNLPDAYEALERIVAGLEVDNQVVFLKPGYALINNSVANLRSQPRHSGELATQALLGMLVKVYKQEENWYLVQTPDMYLAWTDAGALVMLAEEKEVVQYEESEKVVVTEPYAFVRDATGQSVSDVTLGNVLQLTGRDDSQFEVRYPDGRMGFLNRSQAIPYTQWIAGFSDDPEDLVDRARDFMGVPYLWGGTSFKGVDCSGFTKMVYLMNGRIIPRDASQQVHTGELIDESKDFDQLIKGDLLFFGTPKTDSTRERVTHVGMWIGEGKYIHSAGKVKVNSMDPDHPLFNSARYATYLRTKRILNHETDGIRVIR